ELRVAVRHRLLVYDLTEQGQRCLKCAEWLEEMEANAVLAEHLGGFEGRKEYTVGMEFHAIHAELDVVSGEWITIVKDRIVDKVDDPGLRVLLHPGVREIRDKLVVRSDIQQLREDIVIHLNGCVQFGIGRIHIDGCVHRGQGYLTSALRAG